MIITLLNDTVVDTADVQFNDSNYHFYWDSGSGGTIDITNVMTRDQKFFWPNFDPIKDNYRLSNERIAAKGGSITVATMTGPKTIPASQLPLGPVGNTSLWSNFEQGVSNTISSGTSTLATVAIVGLLAYFLLPVLLSSNKS